MLHVTQYAPRHFDGIAALWSEAFPDDRPWNAAAVAIPRKLEMQPELFLIALKSDVLVGSVMAGYDGHRGWISRIAVLERCRGEGVGTSLLQAIESRLAALGCIKINLQVAVSNMSTTAFYEKAGYAIEPRVSMTKLIPQVPMPARSLG